MFDDEEQGEWEREGHASAGAPDPQCCREYFATHLHEQLGVAAEKMKVVDHKVFESPRSRQGTVSTRAHRDA